MGGGEEVHFWPEDEIPAKYIANSSLWFCHNRKYKKTFPFHSHLPLSLHRKTIGDYIGHIDRGRNVNSKENANMMMLIKMALYCPQGSGTLRQQLLKMHGVEW